MEKGKGVALEELLVTHVRGSGPGGQNRNKRMSGIRIEHLPTGIVVMATERRSQAQNYSAAMERLEERLERFYHRDRPRVATKKTKGSQRRRVETKQRHSSVKRERRRVKDWD